LSRDASGGPVSINNQAMKNQSDILLACQYLLYKKKLKKN